MQEEESLSRLIEVKTPWTTYHKVLVRIASYLHVTEREDAFKLFFYGSIPVKNFDLSIEDWLIKLEQSDIISVHKMNHLCDFLEDLNDAQPILSMIKEFQLLLYNLEMINGDSGE